MKSFISKKKFIKNKLYYCLYNYLIADASLCT